jgi:hypothetical protein
LKNYLTLAQFVSIKLNENGKKKETAETFSGLLGNIDTFAELAVRVEVGIPLVKAIYSLGRVRLLLLYLLYFKLVIVLTILEGDQGMIFLANDIIQIARTKISEAATSGTVSIQAGLMLQKKFSTREGITKYVKSVAIGAKDYLEDQILKHTVAWSVITHTSFFCPWNSSLQAGKESIAFFKSRNWIDQLSSEQAIKEIERYIELSKGKIL